MIIDMDNRGFTIVELIIIITVMGILLILGVVNLNSSQANGRDSERRTDAETIAVHLEAYYKSGDDTSTTIGRYPSTALFTTIPLIKRTLRDIDSRSYLAPGIDEPAVSLVAANDNSQVANTIKSSGGTLITKDKYIYQPLKNDNTLCQSEANECSKFNIYFRLETATADCPAPNNVCMITSKNQ